MPIRLKHSLLITCAILFAFVAAQGRNGQERHRLFTEILQQYVSDGHVNYRDLQHD